MTADRGSRIRTDTKNWVVKLVAWPRRILTGSITQAKKRYNQLKKRYGPRYTYAMLTAAFVALFSPIPGTVVVAIALIVAVAEVHRMFFKRASVRKTGPKELVMSMNCDVILQLSATPTELTNLGAALWRWCNHTARHNGIYQHLDNQALADLIAGKLPASSQTGRESVHVKFRDEVSHDRQATIDRLRREIPAKGIEDILVEGKSWMALDRIPAICKKETHDVHFQQVLAPGA